MSPVPWRRAAASALPAFLAVALLALAGVAVAHGGEAEIELEPDTVVAGHTVRVTGENLEDVETVGLVLVGASTKAVLGSADVGDDGHLKVDIVIPADTAGGPYVVEADGPDGPLASAALTVTPAASPSPASSPSPSPAASASVGPSIVPSSASPVPPDPSPDASAIVESAPASTSGSDTTTLVAVVLIAIVAGVGGGILLARRGRQAG